MARLKVFTWSDGFHAFTVATTSRAKALEAWGIKADIFKTGLAREITESADYDAAQASPGEVIERAQSIDVGKIEKAAPKAKPGAAKAKAAVAALKADLAALEAEQAKALKTLEDRRKVLDAEIAALRTEQAQAREALEAKLKAAKAKL